MIILESNSQPFLLYWITSMHRSFRYSFKNEFTSLSKGIRIEHRVNRTMLEIEPTLPPKDLNHRRLEIFGLCVLSKT